MWQIGVKREKQVDSGLITRKSANQKNWLKADSLPSKRICHKVCFEVMKWFITKLNFLILANKKIRKAVNRIAVSGNNMLTQDWTRNEAS